MKAQFWGVRGSIPAPLSPQQVFKKIENVVARISAEDLVSEGARKDFLSSLPKWMTGTSGGNTSCVEVTLSDDTHLILDCGSGIRPLAKAIIPPKNATFHILLSHFHWDHIQGLPFFDFAYDPNYTINFYSAFPGYEHFLNEQMKAPYFPVTMQESFTKKITYHQIEEGKPFFIGTAKINIKKMRHPGGSYAFAVTDGKKKFIYATDVELAADGFKRDDANSSFFSQADAIVLDAQYSFGEAIQKENWGHSAFCYAIDFANFWKIKSVYLFHHEPNYDDEKIYTLYKAAKQYSASVFDTSVKVFSATEGLVVDI
jgi:phosphoribosyl 1,2-cyclic phosphodiesterase